MPRRLKKSKTIAARTSRFTQSAATAGYAWYLAFVLTLPGTERSTSYGTPAIKVKGKLLSRLRAEVDGSLVLRCQVLDRQILLQADPDAFFLTDHYRNYPWILVRLDKISKSSLTDVVLRGWRSLAPKKLLDEFKRADATPRSRHS